MAPLPQPAFITAGLSSMRPTATFCPAYPQCMPLRVLRSWRWRSPSPCRLLPRRGGQPPVGDGQRLRHREAPDASGSARGCPATAPGGGCSCASAPSLLRPGLPRSTHWAAASPPGSRSGRRSSRTRRRGTSSRSPAHGRVHVPVARRRRVPVARKGGKVVRRTRKSRRRGTARRPATRRGFSEARCRINGPAQKTAPRLVEP